MKTPQLEHQKIGTTALVKNKAFALFDEMGIGKSKQVIDAACILAERGEIDTVVVVAPASVRCVWLDAKIGEIRKHAWIDSTVIKFHKKTKVHWDDDYSTPLASIDWIVTNYEFLRNDDHLVKLCTDLLERDTLLVLDESSYIKNRVAAQTKAVAKLRKHCDRCVLLNGTPVTNSPLDLYSQINVLSPKILNGENFYVFRAKYCTMQTKYLGPRHFKQVTGYKDLDKLAERVAPYVLRREKKDCLDLPPKLYTEREVALTPTSWKRYQELKKDFVMSIEGSDDKHLEPNAAVRLMRLAQLTSGILGGVCDVSKPSIDSDESESVNFEIQDLSDEKLKWCVQYLTEECTAKAVIVWTRWRRERERLVDCLRGRLICMELYGGQPSRERDIAVNEFSISENGGEFTTEARRVLVAQPHAGGHGLNLVAASEEWFLSNDFSLGIRLQAEDRAHRPGQKSNLLIGDVLATGPHGERTIDHVIFHSLREKKSLADFTTAQWRKELEND